MGVNVVLLAEYSKIYSELNETIEELLVGIPKKLILKAGTTFLAMQTMDYSSANWLEIANMWFRTENFIFKEELIRRINYQYTKEEVNELLMLSPITSLKLLQLGLSKGETEGSKKEKQIEIDLFKIYLLLNESFTNQHTTSGEYIELHYPENKIGMMLLSMSFSTNDLVNYIYSREFYCQSVKSLFLFSFLKNESKLKPHVELFFKRYSISSMEEYYSRLFGFLKPIGRKIKDRKKGFVEYTIENDEDKEFIFKFSVQDYSEKEDIDFRIIRASPLVQIEKNIYRLTHPLFITDRLYKGLYFDLSKINEELEENEKISSIRSFYTTNFSEKYLFYEVLKYCLKKRYIQFTGSEIDAMGIQGAPDYYIRNGKYIFLIENKDVFIKAEVKENPLFEGLEAELKKKFFEESHGRGVGIKQIVKNIEKVLSVRNIFDTNYKPKNAIIYPVLIVHDIVYDSPGLNCLFNAWFDKEVELLKRKGLPVKNVRPLIVLNIDTLIRVSELLRIGKLRLDELFEVYYKNLKVVNKLFKTEKEMKSLITNTYMPSTKIIENWLDKKHESFAKDDKILEYAYNKMKS